MSTAISTEIINCPNSKLEIKAKNYNKSKIFKMENEVNQRLSRVDSQNYPDTTENLDSLAQKMGFNQQNNKRDAGKLEHSKLNRCSEENLVEKGVSKSFQVTSDRPAEVTPSKITLKKSGFMSNIIRRISSSTPKIFSKNKKHKKSKHSSDKESVDNTNVESKKNPDSVSTENSNNTEKLVNGSSDKNSQFSPRSKSIRKILRKFAKRKGKAKMTSEPPSSIESRPSLSSVMNHGLHFESTNSCNDIYLDKLCKNQLQKNNCSSADCILDYKLGDSTKQRESISSTSEDLVEHDAKLNAAINSMPRDNFSNEFPDLYIATPQPEKDIVSPLSIKTTEFKFDTQRSCHSTISTGAFNTDTSGNVKLTLALHGYCNYGLSSSRLTSKSCMEFRSVLSNRKSKSSVENVSKVSEEKLPKTEESQADLKTAIDSTVVEDNIVEAKDRMDSVENHGTNDVLLRDHETNGSCEPTSVVLRKSQRPNDIKLRRSREPSANIAARSSMIMLVVSHNSPRNKVISNQLPTPNKDTDLNASHNSMDFPAMKLNFETCSTKEKKLSLDETVEDVKKSGNLSTIIDEKVPGENEKKIIENGFTETIEEIVDGQYFLDLVYKNEKDILMKIDIVQKYLDNTEIQFDEEVSGQLLVTIGIAKLLLAEKMVQFKGLCEKNISGIIEENELPTLLTDLNGFWDMVYGQIVAINRNFVLVEKIRLNDWKMIPYEPEERSSSSTPVRSKKNVSKPPRKSSNTNTPTKKKLTTETPPASKVMTAEKRRNLLQFRMNQKASLAQNADSNFNSDITFY